ncbi:L,D-transpeptidase [Rhodoplanes sp. Z2-YC6860]|uniref:L,D-transpeptidase n=1 Tax=Rhodoplanes sp. Z2-YC6860 TaxID=674703 RepID=UPI00078C1406|nr:L,D-transpeptidase [Rhodoplanes sp. Z2-YC6860]AMN41805.1 ErfK/YbiS/YcfS/YnhG family protein [Rhodoplanes sp. Z2-YC6860]
MKRTATVAGVSVVALLCVWTASAAAAPGASGGLFGFFSERPVGPARRLENKADRKPKPDADKSQPVPKGLLHIIVSLDKQRATLFADGVAVAQSKISSGTAEHPTPLGIFSILQKSRHHVSNLYYAPMPFMQRITWSGSALHEGPLPGYPASHGCVRLPNDFAQLLWKSTKLGARVVITRDEVAPVAIEHDRLIFAKAKGEDLPAPPPQPDAVPKLDLKPALVSESKTPPVRDSEPVVTRPAALLKTADASPTLRGITPDMVKPLAPTPVRNTMASEQPTKLQRTEEQDELSMPGAPAVAAEAMAKADVVAAPMAGAKIEAPQPSAPALPAREAPPVVAMSPPVVPPVAAKEPIRRKGVVSMFISLKEQRLYVRQNMEPLFSTPVTIERPGEPIGTHVYTAMGPKAGGDALRWTVVSIPSSYKPVKAADNRKPRNLEYIHAPLQDPRAALDRITMPQDAVDRIADLITPGASLIVSDNKLSGETGNTTDFIVETK